MAEAAEKPTTTRPSRSRATTTKAPAKPVPAKAAPEVAPVAGKFTVELEHAGDTKSYAKFLVPANLKGTVAGSVYAPPGTTTVKVLIVGAEDAPTE